MSYTNLVGHLKMIKGNIMESTFVSGFCNWKDATWYFARHEATSAHEAAVDFTINISGTSRDVRKMLYSAHAKEKASNWQYLLKVAQNIKFLAKQGIVLSGDGNESDSNFMQLMELRALDGSVIMDMLNKKKRQIY